MTPLAGWSLDLLVLTVLEDDNPLWDALRIDDHQMTVGLDSAEAWHNEAEVCR